QLIWDTARTYTSYDAFFKTSIQNYELKGEFDKIIQISEEAEEFVKEGIINTLRFNRKYNAYILVYAHLRNKSFVKGLQYAEKFSSYFDDSTSNWFSFMENYFLLALHAKYYELAYQLLYKVQSNPSYKDIRNDARERWQLYETYLYVFQ